MPSRQKAYLLLDRIRSNERWRTLGLACSVLSASPFLQTRQFTVISLQFLVPMQFLLLYESDQPPSIRQRLS